MSVPHSQLDDRNDNPWADQAERDAEDEPGYCAHDRRDDDECDACDEAAAFALARETAEVHCGKAFEDAELEDLNDAIDSAGLFWVRRLLRDDLVAEYMLVRARLGHSPDRGVA